MIDTTTLQIRSLCHFMSWIGYAPVNVWDALIQDENGQDIDIDTTCYTQGFVKRPLITSDTRSSEALQHYAKPHYLSLRDAQTLHNGVLIRIGGGDIYDMLGVPHLNGKFTQDEIEYAAEQKLVHNTFLQRHRVMHGNNYLKAQNMCVKFTELGKQTDEYKLIMEGEE